jgi:hypothetical protein
VEESSSAFGRRDSCAAATTYSAEAEKRTKRTAAGNRRLARRAGQIFSEFDHPLYELPVCGWPETGVLNKSIEKAEASFPSTPAALRQANPHLSFVLRITSSSQVGGTLHPLQQRRQCARVQE